MIKFTDRSKWRSSPGCSRFLIATVMALSASQALAVTYTWDTVPGTVGVGNGSITGGTGTWNISTGNWTTDAGANNVAWRTTGPANDALFGGTAGTASVDANVTARTLTFSSTGYTLGGAGANENNLAITKSGNGRLTLTGTNRIDSYRRDCAIARAILRSPRP